MRHIFGLDLGAIGDFSALALIRAEPGDKPTWELPTLKRWPLSTTYTEVGRSVARFLSQPDFAGCDLVIDETGVGIAVVELVARELIERQVQAKLARVTITGGNAVTQAGVGRWHVSKRQLVSNLSAVVHGGRLKVARDQPEADALVREMSVFKAKISLSTANESFEAWRERDHDDLVLATALAVWYGERKKVMAGPVFRRGEIYTPG